MPNENSLKNLIPYKPGKTGNPNGRPRTLSKAIKAIPKDAQQKIYSILYTALTFNNVQEATEYIRQQDCTDFRYGFILQIAIRELTGKKGWQALQDILDRLFGKPKISADVSHSGGISLNITTDAETKEMIEGGLG